MDELYRGGWTGWVLGVDGKLKVGQYHSQGDKQQYCVFSSREGTETATGQPGRLRQSAAV